MRFIFVGTGISLKDEMFASSAGLLLSINAFLLTISSEKTKKHVKTDLCTTQLFCQCYFLKPIINTIFLTTIFLSEYQISTNIL